VLEALDPQRFGGLVKGAIANRLKDTEVAPIMGQLLKAAMAENRHKPLLDAAIQWASGALTENEHLIRQIVHDKAGAILRWTGLDETVANKLIDGLSGLLADMASTPEHPLRLRAENGLDRLAWDLRFDPAFQAKGGADQGGTDRQPRHAALAGGSVGTGARRPARDRAGSGARDGRPARRRAAPYRRDAAAGPTARPRDQPLRAPGGGRGGGGLW
jgi:hypothetical protein